MKEKVKIKKESLKKNKTKSKLSSSNKLNIFYEVHSMQTTNIEKVKYDIDPLKEIKDKPNLKFFAIFKDNSVPFYETDEFLEGGFYEMVFSLNKFKNIDFYKCILFFIKFMEKFIHIRGVRFRPKKNLMKIQLWSTDKFDDKIMKVIQFIPEVFHIKFEEKPYFELFYPEPLPDAKDLSMVEMRGKKVNILRFGLMLSNFFHQKKIWWELDLLNVFKKYYIPHTNILDIGANIGSHTLLMTEFISKDNLIFSFEPVYGDVVQRNITDNGLEDKVCLFTQGLGKKNETIEINVMDRMKPNNFGTVSIVKKIETAILKKKIGVITLDSIGLKNISLIKLDVEGMERDVLEGARKTISENYPTIVIEIWPEEMGNFVNSEIGKFMLNECKYEIIPVSGTRSNHDYVLVSKKQKMMDF